jgi:uncharacterized membrane protein (UPF0127 family)
MLGQRAKIIFYCCLLLWSCSTTRGSDGLQKAESSNTPPSQENSVSQKATERQTKPAEKTTQTMPQVVIMPEGRDPIRVDVEVARTPEQRQRGLMFRKHMDPDKGMLFLFERPDHLTFWMHNTYMPLDMIFIEAGMRILGIVEKTTPLSDRTCEVPGESQFVLEVNSGFSQVHDIKRGDKAQFVGIIF